MNRAVAMNFELLAIELLAAVQQFGGDGGVEWSMPKYAEVCPIVECEDKRNMHQSTKSMFDLSSLINLNYFSLENAIPTCSSRTSSGSLRSRRNGN